MRYKNVFILAFISIMATLTTVGCSVVRDQQTVGSYVDDSAITTAIKAKFANSPAINTLSINVETLKGQVQLSGFAKSLTEKESAEHIAQNTKHVRSVINNIVVRE